MKITPPLRSNVAPDNHSVALNEWQTADSFCLYSVVSVYTGLAVTASGQSGRIICDCEHDHDGA